MLNVMKEEGNKIHWSDLSNYQKENLAKIIAEQFIDMEKRMVISMIDDALTPFWVKWFRKLKNKLKKN